MKIKAAKISVIAIVLVLLFSVYACENNYYPKPRGYFRIDFPVKEYKDYSPENCPFSFKIPSYATVASDTFGLVEPCWFDLVYPEFSAKVHLSYKELNNNFFKHAKDTEKLVYKHAAKADAIDPYIVTPNADVTGMIYEIGGNAASSVQFFVSDSTNHFLRGALYFNCSPNEDSLAPVIQFIQKDIEALIATTRWK
ncbi:MAG: gliding motility lipoprotein GldD [Bacteroidia bacterium]|nr:gliding motility lipoprotein GldD [Bacteroidia bacterium]NNM16214.1 gliding motility lipoprotein GldD [Bacteroidia bacterium]